MTSQPNVLHQFLDLAATVAHYVDPAAVFVLVLGLLICGLGLLYGMYSPPRKPRSHDNDNRPGRDL
jgi:hypothetical protein